MEDGEGDGVGWRGEVHASHWENPYPARAQADRQQGGELPMKPRQLHFQGRKSGKNKLGHL